MDDKLRSAGQKGSTQGRRENPRAVDRRTFLRLSAGAAGALVLGSACARTPSVTEPAAPAATAAPAVAPTAAPAMGELVPEIVGTYGIQTPWYADAWRKIQTDLESLGFRVKPNQVSGSEWLDVMISHTWGDLTLGSTGSRLERIDPNELLFSRGHSSEAVPKRRNFGEWIHPEYDRLVEAQAREIDEEKRKELVWKATELMARNHYYLSLVYPDVIQPYNADDWEGVVPTLGNGIAGTEFPWTYLNLKPKTGRKRLVVGRIRTVRTTNVIGPGGAWRDEGKFVYDRLVQLDQNLKPVPWAAESWNNVDPLTWDVKLRQGMKWHDGRPVTVEDLKFTFDYWLDHQPGMLSVAWQPLEKVEILDNQTVRFTTKEPFAAFVGSILAVSFLMPKHQWENLLEEQGIDDPSKAVIDNPIGSGFFKFGHHIKDQELLLIANKDHWAAPAYDELLFIFIPTMDGLLGRMQTKEIDLIEDELTVSQAEDLEKLPHVKTVRTPSYTNHYLIPFVAREPWRDPQLREALMHAVDRSFIKDVLLEGAASVAGDPIFGPAHPWHNPNIPAIDYDLEKARSILRDAGYSWDDQGRLHYPPADDTDFKARVEKMIVD